MAFAPTMCFNRSADAFLTSWMNSLRADQLSDGQVPVIIPYLPAYKKFMIDTFAQETSCGWGDAVIMVPYAMYKAYGDRQILETNYSSMTHWMEYIVSRARQPRRRRNEQHCICYNGHRCTGLRRLQCKELG